MRDLYLKVPDYNTLRAHLQANDIIIEGNYLQNEQFILDYIGKIPKAIDEEDNVTEWTANDRFNVRLIDEELILFDGFESISPETPYRMFS